MKIAFALLLTVLCIACSSLPDYGSATIEQGVLACEGPLRPPPDPIAVAISETCPEWVQDAAHEGIAVWNAAFTDPVFVVRPSSPILVECNRFHPACQTRNIVAVTFAESVVICTDRLEEDEGLPSWTLTHELGHVLGLDDRIGDPESIMCTDCQFPARYDPAIDCATLDALEDLQRGSLS